MRLIFYIIIIIITIVIKELKKASKNADISSYTKSNYTTTSKPKKEEIPIKKNLTIDQILTEEEDTYLVTEDIEESQSKVDLIVSVQDEGESLASSEYNIKSSGSNFYEVIQKDNLKSKEFRKEKFNHRSDYYEENWYKNLSDLSVVMTRIICEQKTK